MPVVPPGWWHIHTKAVSWHWVTLLPPKASQEPRARLGKQIQPNPSFQTGNSPLLPSQNSSWGCDPLLAMHERSENLTWRGR